MVVISSLEMTLLIVRGLERIVPFIDTNCRDVDLFYNRFDRAAAKMNKDILDILCLLCWIVVIIQIVPGCIQYGPECCFSCYCNEVSLSKKVSFDSILAKIPYKSTRF